MISLFVFSVSCLCPNTLPHGYIDNKYTHRSNQIFRRKNSYFHENHQIFHTKQQNLKGKNFSQPLIQKSHFGPIISILFKKSNNQKTPTKPLLFKNDGKKKGPETNALNMPQTILYQKMSQFPTVDHSKSKSKQPTPNTLSTVLRETKIYANPHLANKKGVFNFRTIFNLQSEIQKQTSKKYQSIAIQESIVVKTFKTGFVTLTLYDNGTAIISGTGAMDDSSDYWNDWGSYKDSFTSLIIEFGVTYIGSYSFRGFSELKGTLDFPFTVWSIGAYAFEGTNFIGSLIMPSIHEIGLNAFSSCLSFNGDLVLSDDLERIEDYVFGSCPFTGTLNIPSKVTSIGTFGFNSCSGFSGPLKLPNGLSKLDTMAFYDCNGLTGDIEIPTGITVIGIGLFERCYNFNGKLILHDTITTIEHSAFSKCSSLTGDLIIPSSVTSIQSNAFYECSKFTGNLKIPDGVKVITQNAFFSCSGLNGTLEMPAGLTSIQTKAFGNCHSLSGTLVIPKTVDLIGDTAFMNARGFIGEIVISGSPTIGPNAFLNCINVHTIFLSDTISTIGYSCFQGCSSLINLTLPQNLKIINSFLCKDCTSLKYLVLPNDFTEVGKHAFSNTPALCGVMVTGEQRAILQTNGLMANDAFIECKVISSSDQFTFLGKVNNIGFFGFVVLWLLN